MYKLILINKLGKFLQSLTINTLQEAEKIGYNHTFLENYSINAIPIKNERLFTIWEITNNFNIMDVISLK
jgi:hypothetical protein